MDSPQSPRVLVVDDDPTLRELLTDYLGASGFQVEGAADGVQMRARMAQAWPDVLVLDLMLPGEDGLSLARELRRHSDLPILMLSARGEEIDRVIGLEVGADDYLAKPFGPRELLARLRALLRRSHPAAPTPSPPEAATSPAPALAPPAEAATLHRFGPYTLDPQAWRLLRDGSEVAVTSAEFALLRLFVQHPNRVLSRDDLIERLKGYERDAFDRSIDTRVTRLRRRIESDPAHPVYIRTVRGEGYLFNPRGEAA
ncbi:response regulator [Sphaerotilus microaerophilus]|uniref:DNA-binding response regulator n=1 Tax=Sphaerotilus microaerophilus TaxID=2914710 RepID=A0ABN6PUB3_9BURK|nr:response regulator [Sphaerotilus sp. FB-5]BDI07683.1 DNA-binding response regulator [Sphaerotilus sp. FB-5]